MRNNGTGRFANSLILQFTFLIPIKKKACPEKSRPLLTYEKHQLQISHMKLIDLKLIGKEAKNSGISFLYSILIKDVFAACAVAFVPFLFEQNFQIVFQSEKTN